MSEKSKDDSNEDLNKDLSSAEENNTELEKQEKSLTDEEYESLKQKLLDEYSKYIGEEESSEDDKDNLEEEVEESEAQEDLNEEVEESEAQDDLNEEVEESEAQDDLNEEVEESEAQDDLNEEVEESEAQDDLNEEVEESEVQDDLDKEYNELQENLSSEYEKQELEQKEDNNTNNSEKYKYDLDEDSELEIEDLSQSDGKILEQPKELTEKQKNISPEIEQGSSKVAISKGSSLLMMIVFGIGLIFVIYQVMSPSTEELATQTHSEIDKNLPITKPINDTGQTIVVPEIPKLPEVPKLAPPAPPPAPVPPVPPVLNLNIPAPPPPVAPKPAVNPAITPPPAATSTAQISTIVTGSSTEADAAAKAAADRKKAKINSAMLTGGGGGGPASRNVNPEGQSLTSLSRNSNAVVATYIGDLQRVIAQGKVLDAVLETAINTDLPGSLRAIVSRDVYSESGKNILIPRGSRLIGTYNSNVAFGIARVQITWNRVVRPDGVDVQISSPGVDNLGRSGTAGVVDNHILRNLSTALMVSALDIGLATYLDKNTDTSSDSTQVTVSGGVSTTGGASTTGTVVTPTTTVGTPPTNVEGASATALENVQDVGKQIMAKTMAMPPTITVDQGTPLKVYIQRDIIFPGSSANLTKVIE